MAAVVLIINNFIDSIKYNHQCINPFQAIIFHFLHSDQSTNQTTKFVLNNSIEELLSRGKYLMYLSFACY
jgi:hypothetical protein